MKKHSQETLKKYNKGKEMYLTGEWSLTRISKELGMSCKWFVEWIREQDGIEIINKQNIVTTSYQCFDKIDTEEKAYWLGFLYADGHVSVNTNNTELTLSHKDRHHVQKFKDFLGCSNKISKREIQLGGKRYHAARLSFKSKVIKKQLVKLGCTPQKTYGLSFPTESQVPLHLQHHFVRGYIDGDGSLMLNREEPKARLGICGTREFLNGIVENMGWHRTKMQKKGNCYQIEYSGVTNAVNLLVSIYEGSKIHLNRKFKIYQDMKIAVYGKSDD